MPLNIDTSYYSTGTATVAADGTTVTGQSTAWLQAVRAGDLFGTHVGDPVRIASVDSNTQLTLAYPWKGPAQTESAYEIQFTPYDTGYQAAVRQLLTMLASGNVEALANLVLEAGDYIRATGPGVVEKVSGKNLDALRGLTGGADKLPYFNGDDTMAQTALTEFARTLLDDADAATARATLGANNATNLTTGTLDTDRLPNSFGSSRYFDTANGVTSLLQWRTSGALRWAFGKDSTSEAGSNSGSHLSLYRYDDSGAFLSRILSANRTTGIVTFDYMPEYNGNDIVESGTNANGRYVKFADGTMICSHADTTAQTTSTAQGGIYHSGAGVTLTFPAAFSAAPDVTRFSHRQGVSGAINYTWASPIGNNDVTTTSVRIAIISGASNSVGGAGYIAVGRWL